MLSILFGLGAALGWGAGDFTGGLASRKTGAYRAVFYSEMVGIFLLFAVVQISGESLPNLKVWLLAMLAGAVGTVGLMLLYHSMTLGLMSVATPVSALLAASIPVLVGTFKEGFPDVLTILGFGFALFAVWMISQGKGGVKDILAHLASRGFKPPLLAGIDLAFTLSSCTKPPAQAQRFGRWSSRSGSGMILIVTYMLITAPHGKWRLSAR